MILLSSSDRLLVSIEKTRGQFQSTSQGTCRTGLFYPRCTSHLTCKAVSLGPVRCTGLPLPAFCLTYYLYRKQNRPRCRQPVPESTRNPKILFPETYDNKQLLNIVDYYTHTSKNMQQPIERLLPASDIVTLFPHLRQASGSWVLLPPLRALSLL